MELVGITVLERGWLSSNNVVLHGRGHGGAVLVDTGHTLHAEQTVALVRHALGGEPLDRIVNTHLHSDHCGGNAALRRAFGVPVVIPPGQADAVARWDEHALTYASTGQVCERYAADAVIAPGEAFVVGGRRWQAVAAPGHDPHALMFFEPDARVLISADALWGNGFGIVFPELDGEPGFDDVELVLDLVESLAPRAVIPGHGAPFADVAGALARARSRLAAYRADPERHLRHGIKVLVKYHLLECKREPLGAFERWFAAMPLARHAFARLGEPGGELARWGRGVVDELAAAGALAVADGVLLDRSG